MKDIKAVKYYYADVPLNRLVQIICFKCLFSLSIAIHHRSGFTPCSLCKPKLDKYRKENP
jgi:hypothetical protein